MSRRLEGLFRAAAEACPGAPALADPDRGVTVTYRELAALARTVEESLGDAGVGPGDRVGVYAPKSIASVAAILAILGRGAAYVPVDPSAPTARNSLIFLDCGVKAVVADPTLGARLPDDGRFAVGNNLPVRSSAGVDLVQLAAVTPASTFADAPSDLAYVLYTSGSTGRPKGVMHTHSSALAFVDWCVERFEPVAEDRFSSHAPFHFDLSIHDLYVPLTIGASIVLIGEDSGKRPQALADLVADADITVWYSTPSILRLMVEYGGMSAARYDALRIVHFAGEVFPTKHLRSIKAIWTKARFFNLYGPTETNVCTFYPIPDVIPEDRSRPYPIGYPCSGDRCRVVAEDAQEVAPGAEGELVVSGASVMAGYWNLPDRGAAPFVTDPDGTRWYRTGDVVSDLGDQCFDFVGRRDRMIKRRGYRVELGEIEAALHRHGGISEAAVVGLADEQVGTRVKAYVVWSGKGKPSIVQMKQFCSQELPLYMIPDEFAFRDALPKTSTDKIDYQRLLTDA